MAELRRSKRKASEPAQATAPPPAKKATKAAPKPKQAEPEPDADVEDIKTKKQTNGKTASKASKVVVGDKITLDGFGGEVETNEGEPTTLKELVAASESGVVLFTYPKASTPGCTTQVCLFRDSYTPLTATGFKIYGLSADSPKANTTFKTKQNLPYPLLCDSKQTLIEAIGMKKAPKGTSRGVFVVSKEGEVLAAEGGGPAATVEVVRKLTEGRGKKDTKDEEAETAAEIAAEVADTAEKIDGTE